MQKNISPLIKFNKVLSVPSDKSISHRAVMLGSIAKGTTSIINPLFSEDVLASVDCARRLGANCEVSEAKIIVSAPKNGLASANLYANNSGTTMRLYSGILSGLEGREFVFSGDESLSKRPMDRISEPLKLMGADITLTNKFCPITIKGKSLKGINYTLKQNSAQVKSCILFAGLNADGITSVTETAISRDHSERMLALMGANIKKEGMITTIKPSQLQAINLHVAGDISSAAFLLVLAAAKSGNSVTIKNVSLNPTRTGILDVLLSMGADVKIENFTDDGEPFGDITLTGRNGLKPFSIDGEIVPRLIDEIPVLAVLACFVEGESVIRGAMELRVKESDRITAVTSALRTLGAEVEPLNDGMRIFGKGYLDGGGAIQTHFDHRLAMSMAVAAALSKKGATILNAECVNVSYPDFYSVLE